MWHPLRPYNLLSIRVHYQPPLIVEALSKRFLKLLPLEIPLTRSSILCCCCSSPIPCRSKLPLTHITWCVLRLLSPSSSSSPQEPVPCAPIRRRRSLGSGGTIYQLVLFTLSHHPISLNICPFNLCRSTSEY